MESYPRSNLINDKYPITAKMVRLLKEHGVTTGSFVFGGYDPTKSDVDIVIPPNIMDPENMNHGYVSMNTFKDNIVYLSGDYADEHENFASFYVKTDRGTLLNILIVCSVSEFILWKKATRLMIKILSLKHVKSICKDKYKRVELFKSLKELYRLPPTGDCHNDTIDDVPF